MNKIKIILALLVIAGISTSFKGADKVNIWLVGDSTMAAKKAERKPESGWGVELSDYVTGKAKVHNHAASGRSTKSFVDEGRWKTVKDSLKKGDYVVIQFGHNDEKPEPKLHTDAQTSFKDNLRNFVRETRDKGGIPIICSSIVRRHFDEKGNLVDSHGEYIEAAEEVARETNTFYVDMEKETRQLVIKLGMEKSKELYNYGKKDDTHLNHYGAGIVAGLFVKEIKYQQLELAKLFK
ncbi:Lysophospholipase L1 [Flavobacterium fluvii]|uniref:Lysophospholipase L1 n=1 Tax=Flavobacterium fluvii TaxID=468056 RepID=A0A1M5HBX6_9FLAO|nr:rhamnogalacturonan acetylesterase [Flavobacterium fluvii]SHG13302.1 Lysophospholipase L1 [Flavobacterium fluvii]